MSQARELWTSWKTVVHEDRVTEEPLDGRCLRSLLNVWRRHSDGLWRSTGSPGGDGVKFKCLAATLSLREIKERTP